MARYNKTPQALRLVGQTPGAGGYGGMATLPNMKPMPQVDPHQQDYANWFKQVTAQGYTPMYRSPLDGKPYQVDSTGLRSAVDERQFQTVYPSELGNSGGDMWGGPKSSTLQPQEWQVPQGMWARQAPGLPSKQEAPRAMPPMAQWAPVMGDPAGFGGGQAPGLVAGGYQPGLLQDPAMQAQMQEHFRRNLGGNGYAMAQQSALNDAMTRQSVIDMGLGTGLGAAVGGLASFFTGDPGYSQWAEKQSDAAYKRRQELAANTNNLVNNSQQNYWHGFNMLMQSDPQSIKNQTAMANAAANMQRANAYGQSINNNMALGQNRNQLGWAQLAQKDRQFAQTAQQAQARLQMEQQRLQYEGQRIGLSQQQIEIQKQQLAQNYDLGLQRLAQQREATQLGYQGRMAGLQQDYDQMEQQNQQFWANQQNQGYQAANEQGYDSNAQKPYFKMSDLYRQNFQQPAAAPQQAQGGGMPLDAQTAQRFLQQAGGDKNMARQLARAAGYRF